MIGYGPLKAKLISMAADRHLLGTVMKFDSPKPRVDIANILGKSKIFVIPSTKEGMPLALLEAMASGQCVIGSDIAGINDLITNGVTGILVPSKNSVELANAILAVANDEKLRNSLGVAAREAVSQKYSLNEAIVNLDQAYLEIIC